MWVNDSNFQVDAAREVRHACKEWYIQEQESSYRFEIEPIKVVVYWIHPSRGIGIDVDYNRLNYPLRYPNRLTAILARVFWYISPPFQVKEIEAELLFPVYVISVLEEMKAARCTS